MRTAGFRGALRPAARALGWISMSLLAIMLVSGAAQARLRLAASIPDLASIASSVGGDQVEAFALARPNTDVHRVEVLPSYMVRVAKADLYLKVGMGLDLWADAIIDGSRNARLQVLDCSVGIVPLEKPVGKVDAAMGDVHPDGNPHYWLDPQNGAIAARRIGEALARLDPAHADDFARRAEAFAKEAEEAAAAGRDETKRLASRSLLTYHSSWAYFAHAFDLSIEGSIEPVPGIPPTGKHLQDLVEIVRERKVPVLIQEPYFSDEAGRFLSRQTPLRVIRVAASCASAEPGAYLDHIREVLRLLAGSGGDSGALVPSRSGNEAGIEGEASWKR